MNESAEQDFKLSLIDRLDGYCMKPVVDTNETAHTLSFNIPGRTSMEAAARFFSNMICKYTGKYFLHDSPVFYNDASIGIGYDAEYQCLVMGIEIYEG